MGREGCSKKTALVIDRELAEADREILLKKIREHSLIYLCGLLPEQRDRMLRLCYDQCFGGRGHGQKKRVYCRAELSDILLRNAGISRRGDRMLYCLRGIPMGRFQAFWKRCFDLIFSLALLVLLWPLLAALAVCIRAEDGGSVYYRQTRCTKDMKQFEIIKFRSMVREAGQERRISRAEPDDARVTRIGRFMRRWKLDELPQLVNILRGEMSFVGPRPERPELMEEAMRELPEFKWRTGVKAGLTGYAQVMGGYSTEYQDKLRWDLEYIQNYSFRLDIWILARTIPAIFRGEEQDY